MPYTLVQAGANLKSINTSGVWSSALSLPSGVALATNRTPRFAKFNQYVVMVNSPTKPISIDATGKVRYLTPYAPGSAVALTGPNAGTLTGTYLALQTYKLLDSLGNVVAESDYGPAMSAAVTIATKKLLATFGVSGEDVDGTQLYRTATSGGVYFPWVLVSGNTATTAENDLSDATIGLVAAPSLGSAPDLTLICEWAGRLWGVSRTAIDALRYTEAGTMYGWSALNTLNIPHIGEDAAGVTALIPRRDALGVARLDVFNQVTGSTRSNFAPRTVNGGEAVGCVSQESVVVFNDIAYFLWRDGVYKWDSNGISCVTNGLVRSWFTSDTYFNRALFWRAFAELDPAGLTYRLFLASAGSTVIDRWIEFDINTGTWWGPHSTAVLTPTSAFLVAGANQQRYFMLGSLNGYLSQDQEDRNDWNLRGIPIHIQTKKHHLQAPDTEKYFGEVSVMGKEQPAGTVTVTPTVGDLEATPGTPMTYDMTQDRQRLGRMGVGRFGSLDFTHDTIDEDVAIYGYEINPVRPVGRR